MKKNKIMVFTTLLCLLPIVFGIILYDKLPQDIPSHFDFNGNVDGYTAKPLFVFGLPCFFAIMNLFMCFAIKYDPKNHNQNQIMVNLPKYVMPILSILMMSFTYYKVIYNDDFNFSKIILVFVGILFIVVGNYLPKCRQNYTIGIKLPWTLNDSDNWNKTHRLAGYLWVIAGILMIIFNFILPDEYYGIFFIVTIFTVVLIPTIYSFIMYRNSI